MKTSYPIRRRGAFTLIELLTVIAVIGILASILIPTVGAAKKSANKAKTKAQFTGWANALQQFKSTYGYYPSIFTNDSLNLSSGTNSREFIETLSGRDDDGDPVQTGGNRRAASFYSFAEGEFEVMPNGSISSTQLADAFNNTNIIIKIDKDNDGQITGLPDDATGSTTARVKVAIYSEEDDAEGFVGVYSWE